MGGDGSGNACTRDFDCGIYGHCIVGDCDNSLGSGNSCYDGNNGGCDMGMICLPNSGGPGTRCI